MVVERFRYVVIGTEPRHTNQLIKCFQNSVTDSAGGFSTDRHNSQLAIVFLNSFYNRVLQVCGFKLLFRPHAKTAYKCSSASLVSDLYTAVN